MRPEARTGRNRQDLRCGGSGIGHLPWLTTVQGGTPGATDVAGADVAAAIDVIVQQAYARFEGQEESDP